MSALADGIRGWMVIVVVVVVVMMADEVAEQPATWPPPPLPKEAQASFCVIDRLDSSRVAARSTLSGPALVSEVGPLKAEGGLFKTETHTRERGIKDEPPCSWRRRRRRRLRRPLIGSREEQAPSIIILKRPLRGPLIQLTQGTQSATDTRREPAASRRLSCYLEAAAAAASGQHASSRAKTQKFRLYRPACLVGEADRKSGFY